MSRDLVERADKIKRIQEEIDAAKEELAEQYKEAKSAGYNTRVLKRVVKELGMDRDKYVGQLELEMEIDTYRANVGLETGPRYLETRAARDALEARAAQEAAEKAEALRDAGKLGAVPGTGGAGRKASADEAVKRHAAAKADKYVPRPEAEKAEA